MRHDPTLIRWWPLLFAFTMTMLLSVEARELSLYRVEPGGGNNNNAGGTTRNNSKKTTILKHRAVREQTSTGLPAAETASTTGKTSSITATTKTTASTTTAGDVVDSDRTLTMVLNERASSEAQDSNTIEDSTMLTDKVDEEEVEEERLHRERREMFLRNLQLDGGGGTSLMIVGVGGGGGGGTAGIPPAGLSDLSMSMSSPFEPIRHGVNSGGDDTTDDPPPPPSVGDDPPPTGGATNVNDKETVEKCPPPAIDLPALRDKAADYELQGGETKSGEQQQSDDPPTTVDLFELRKKAVEHYKELKVRLFSPSIDLTELRIKAKSYEDQQRNLSGRSETYLRNGVSQTTVSNRVDK